MTDTQPMDKLSLVDTEQLELMRELVGSILSFLNKALPIGEDEEGSVSLVWIDILMCSIVSIAVQFLHSPEEEEIFIRQVRDTLTINIKENRRYKNEN